MAKKKLNSQGNYQKNVIFRAEIGAKMAKNMQKLKKKEIKIGAKISQEFKKNINNRQKIRKKEKKSWGKSFLKRRMAKIGKN